MEEEKKKAEMENVQRRKAMSDKADDPNNAASGPEVPAGEAGSADAAQNADGSVSARGGGADDDDSLLSSSHNGGSGSSKLKTAWDKITIPKLEKYSGYDHPRPLWLLVKDGVVVYELHSANPPKMLRMIQAVLANTPLSEKELAEYDFVVDPVAAQKRREKRPTKEQKAELARLEALEAKRRARREKPEVQRPPEFLIQARISGIHRPPSAAIADPQGLRQPLLVLYTKDAASDDFTYYSQAERIIGELNPVYHRNFSFPVSDIAALMEQDGVDMELKFVLYDAPDESVIHNKDPAHPPVLGDAYVHLKTLLNGGEGGVWEAKLKPHHTAAPEAQKSGRDNKKAAAAAALAKAEEEKKQDEEGSGLLQLVTKLRVGEGAVTQYRLHMAARNLPALTRAEGALGVAEVQPSLTNEDGSSVDSALLDSDCRREYILELTQSDQNHLRAQSLGLTEVVAGTSDPSFSLQPTTLHATRDPRVLTFLLYDAAGLEGLQLDGLTHSTVLAKHLLGSASVSFESLLLQRRQFANSITLPLVDATGAALVGLAPGSTASLLIQADELNPLDGSVEEFDINDFEAYQPVVTSARNSHRDSHRASHGAHENKEMEEALHAAAAADVDAQARAEAASSADAEAAPVASGSRPASSSGTARSTASATAGGSGSKPSSRSASRPISAAGRQPSTVSASGRPASGSGTNRSTTSNAAPTSPKSSAAARPASGSANKPSAVGRQGSTTSAAGAGTARSQVGSPSAGPVAAATEPAPAAGSSRPTSASVKPAAAASASRPSSAAPKPVLSRPVTASQKLEHNLALKDAEAAAPAIAEAVQHQAEASVHKAVEESAIAAQEFDPVPSHGQRGGSLSMGPPSDPAASTYAPAPGGVVSATATDAASS